MREACLLPSPEGPPGRMVRHYRFIPRCFRIA